MTIQEFLNYRRTSLGLTMKDVSEAVGVAEATVSRWESGDIANLRRDRINSLAKVLKVSPALLVMDDIQINVDEIKVKDELNACLIKLRDKTDMQRLVNSADKLSPEDLAFVINLVEKMGGRT